jgi:signal transduction histidine kinase
MADNGRGLDPRPDASEHRGLGLNNMRQRAEKLRGTFEVASPVSGGTALTWEVPVTQ